MTYLKCFEKAIFFIEDHLGDKLSVNQVADHVGYSYYHLTRLFQGLLGENVGSYIQKRRLALSSQKLLTSRDRIIDVALESGFESSEAYSRAFKKVYQVSPSHYRKNKINLYLSHKRILEKNVLEHLQHNITVQPVIKCVEETHVVGIVGETNLEVNTLPALWSEFIEIVHDIPYPHPSKRSFGICQTSQRIHEFSTETFFTELVGIEVSLVELIPEPFKAVTIRPGKYAVFTHTGPLKELTKTYDYIWGTWFALTKEKVADRVDFELYDDRFLGPDHPESEMDICIPII